MPYFDSISAANLLILPTLLLVLITRFQVRKVFRTYSHVRSARGLTGADAARGILDAHGLERVRVEAVAGRLTDHYDPQGGVIRLSEPVFGAPTIAAVGVAAHEAGHAIQHAEGYGPLRVRNAIIPVTNFGSSLSMPIFVLGLLLGVPALTTAGILLFSLMTVFQLVTLPVETNASHRALSIISERGLLTPEETEGARKVLTAAALTYVAALATSAIQLLRLILLRNRRSG